MSGFCLHCRGAPGSTRMSTGRDTCWPLGNPAGDFLSGVGIVSGFTVCRWIQCAQHLSSKSATPRPPDNSWQDHLQHFSSIPMGVHVCHLFPPILRFVAIFLLIWDWLRRQEERQYTELGIRASGPCSSAVEEQADFGEKWSDSGNSAPKAMRG